MQESPGYAVPYSKRKSTLLRAVSVKLSTFPLNCGLLSDASHDFKVFLTTTVHFQTHLGVCEEGG